MRRGPIALTVLETDSSAANRLVNGWGNAEDMSHAAARQRPGARAESLLGRAALRALLALRTGDRDWALGRYPEGGPFARAKNGRPGPFVSISHSDGLVACATSDEDPIGIDIERHRSRSVQAIADYAFGPVERVAVGRDGMAAFYRIWTLREAVAKATKRGLAQAADGRDLVGEGPMEGCWIAGYSGQSFRVAHFVPKPGYSLAIALPGEDRPWGPEEISFADLSATAIDPSRSAERALADARPE